MESRIEGYIEQTEPEFARHIHNKKGSRNVRSMKGKYGSPGLVVMGWDL